MTDEWMVSGNRTNGSMTEEWETLGEAGDADPPSEAEPAQTNGTAPTNGTAAAPHDPGDRFREAAKRAIEAMVMVAEEPMAPHLLAQLLEISPVVVDALCRELADAYEAEDRGFQLIRVAGGWRYQSHPDQAPYVERLVLEGQTAKLSAAALETLAIVAYKQPISRAQVAAIRGVSVDGVMRTLQQRGFIVEVGKDPGPGQAVMFGTSVSFLQKLGLNNLNELPPLGDFVPTAQVVEQLERGLRPDRQPLRPEDAMAPAPIEDADE
jgi:segregation and condensation protein B